MLVQRHAARMTGDDRLRRRLERVVEGALAGVREVDDDAEPVHATDDLAPEPRQSGRHVGARAVLTRAHPRKVVVPHQRHHAQPALVEVLELAQIFLDRVSTLDAGDAGNAAVGARPGELARIAHQAEAVGVAFSERVRRVEHGPGALEGSRDVLLGVHPADDHPGTETALGPAHQVEVSGAALAEVVPEVQRAPDRVHVRVEDGTAPDELQGRGGEPRGRVALRGCEAHRPENRARESRVLAPANLTEARRHLTLGCQSDSRLLGWPAEGLRGSFASLLGTRTWNRCLWEDRVPRRGTPFAPLRSPRVLGTLGVQPQPFMSIPRRILLADDDVEVRLGVADLLGGLGLEVLHAESGIEALEVARAQSIDAALLDMYMPGYTGIEILPLLFEQRTDLRCIVYSGRWSPDLEQAVLQAGGMACLKKPVEPDRLRQEVLRAIEMDRNN